MVLKLLLKMAKEYQKTIVIVTHNANIAKIADIVIHVRSGKISSIENNQDILSIDELEW
jgi:putative ABC transport system ATP-binding protein